MAMTELQQFHVRPPEHIDPERISFTYNPKADILLCHFSGAGRAAVTLEGGEFLAVRVDPTTEELVGIQIDAFMAKAVIADPILLELAFLVGIPEKDIEAARRRIEPQRAKEVVVGAILDRLFGPQSSFAIA